MSYQQVLLFMADQPSDPGPRPPEKPPETG